MAAGPAILNISNPRSFHLLYSYLENISILQHFPHDHKKGVLFFVRSKFGSYSLKFWLFQIIFTHGPLMAAHSHVACGLPLGHAPTRNCTVGPGLELLTCARPSRTPDLDLGVTVKRSSLIISKRHF